MIFEETRLELETSIKLTDRETESGREEVPESPTPSLERALVLGAAEWKESGPRRLEGVGGCLLVVVDNLVCMSKSSAIPKSIWVEAATTLIGGDGLSPVTKGHSLYRWPTSWHFRHLKGMPS